jgi:glutamate N-acetyltransferase/amino-acid N-acetyltransferase
MAKGSGMIHPNMATMLSTITTDATLRPDLLRAALRHAADRSFHCISVDGDTSTNDTLLALANGQADLPPITSLDTPDGQAFLASLTALCQHLAREVARDGEGATRFVTIHVRGAASDADAHHAAMTVARSPLVKTAIFGADPNWGRIVCALGYSQATLDPSRLMLYFGDIKVFAQGVPLDFDEQAAHQLLSQPDVLIDADLGLGDGSATAWTCDFSYDYVKINAEYRS